MKAVHETAAVTAVEEEEGSHCVRGPLAVIHVSGSNLSIYNLVAVGVQTHTLMQLALQ